MKLIHLPAYEKLGKKVRNRTHHLRFFGVFTEEESLEKGMRLVLGREDGLTLYFLVDESDGVIADAKYQVYGSIFDMIAAEVLSELVIRKNYDQASRVSADLIDQHLRDEKSRPAFPEEGYGALNKVISALDHAVSLCLDIPCQTTYERTPIEKDFPEIPGGVPGWDSFSDQERLGLIEGVIEQEIRPYIELDAGGVRVLEFKNGGELHIAYEGSCTSCHSATGSTLSAIQHILRARLNPSIVVIPKI